MTGRTRFTRWLRRPEQRPLLYFAMGVALLLVAASAFDAYEHQSERRARNQAIAVALQKQHQSDVKTNDKIYQSALRQCRRGKGVRVAIRANALASQRINRVLRGFLTGARPRALAQSKDPNISAKSRVAARQSLTSIDAGIVALSARLTIPPPPPRCVDVITNPNAPPALPHHR